MTPEHAAIQAKCRSCGFVFNTQTEMHGRHAGMEFCLAEATAEADRLQADVARLLAEVAAMEKLLKVFVKHHRAVNHADENPSEHTAAECEKWQFDDCKATLAAEQIVAASAPGGAE